MYLPELEIPTAIVTHNPKYKMYLVKFSVDKFPFYSRKGLVIDWYQCLLQTSIEIYLTGTVHKINLNSEPVDVSIYLVR